MSQRLPRRGALHRGRGGVPQRPVPVPAPIAEAPPPAHDPYMAEIQLLKEAVVNLTQSVQRLEVRVNHLYEAACFPARRMGQPGCEGRGTTRF